MDERKDWRWERNRRNGREIKENLRSVGKGERLMKNLNRGKDGGNMKKVRMKEEKEMVRYMEKKMKKEGEKLIEGVWEILGKGNVEGMGEEI